MSKFDFDNVDVSKLTQADFDAIDLHSLNPGEVYKVVLLYRQFNELKAFPAWDNADPPYSIGEMKPRDALINADYIYLLSDTKMGRPAVMELEGIRYMPVTLKRNLVYEENESYYGLIAHQHNIKIEDLYLYKCDLRFIKAQMHNFKCDTICLMDADTWHDIDAIDLEDDDE